MAAGIIVEPQIDAFPAGVSNEFVRFRLRGIVGPAQFSGSSVTVTATLDAGTISQQIIPNSIVSPSGSFYTVEFWSNGRVVTSENLTITTGGDLSTLL